MVCHERLSRTCTPFPIFLSLFVFILNNRLLIAKYQHCLLCQPLHFFPDMFRTDASSSSVSCFFITIWFDGM